MTYNYNNNLLEQNEIPSELLKLIDEKSNFIIVKNGHLVYKNLSVEFDNVYLEDYNVALTDMNELLSTHLDSFEKDTDGLKYHYENINSGLLIKLENIAVKSNLNLYIMNTIPELVHNTVAILDNSSLTINEYLLNTDECYINYSMNSIVDNDSCLDILSISRYTSKACVFTSRNAYVNSGSSCEYVIGEINDAFVNSAKNKAYLNSKNCKYVYKNIAVVSNQQEVKVINEVIHNDKKTYSNIENYGVASGESILIFDTINKINMGCSKSAAHQSTLGIVIGSTSELHANPILLIDEYDVEASHGVAIGEIDPEQIYYLMSRGLSLELAKKIIVKGYLAPIIEKIDNEYIINDLLNTLEQKTE